ncbi:MAG: hypothetical protein JETT_3338 [Candidatus Jettenia ecosi]|uniref:Uncharacterized protein n=1 Tax=Candidatus Jettenia ecosi TaxID=2494326 RepID=A0A533Q705_9BACT|nr:MAG: hypothetical protein JETT_3338 [Candidatus Jettenia ecosi]
MNETMMFMVHTIFPFSIYMIFGYSIGYQKKKKIWEYIVR